MPAWWDSVDSVATFGWWMRWLGIGFTALAAICGGLALKSIKRGETLTAKRDADRRLTLEQKTKILEVLRANQQDSVVITCVGNDPESNTFADDIVAVLKEGGWKAPKQGVVTNLPPDEGLILWRATRTVNLA